MRDATGGGMAAGHDHVKRRPRPSYVTARPARAPFGDGMAACVGGGGRYARAIWTGQKCAGYVDVFIVPVLHACGVWLWEELAPLLSATPTALDAPCPRPHAKPGGHS